MPRNEDNGSEATSENSTIADLVADKNTIVEFIWNNTIVKFVGNNTIVDIISKNRHNCWLRKEANTIVGFMDTITLF